jgi:hypothetical protein
MSNKEQITETLAALGPMPFGPLQEASGVPSGSFGRVLRELVQTGEVERDDSRYQLPVNGTTRAYCAMCGGSHEKRPGGGWACTAAHNSELAAS